MGDYYPHQPEHCPEGHPLGPGQASRSYSSEAKSHYLYCNACNGTSRILLEDGAEWQVHIGVRWVTFEG